MTRDVPPSQPFFQMATQTLQSLEQRVLRLGGEIPDPASLDRLIQGLETVALGAESFDYEQPIQIARRIQSILRQLKDKGAKLDSHLQTQILEGMGTLVVMIQAMAVSEGPALSVLDRLSEGILPTLTRAEAYLQHLPVPTPESEARSEATAASIEPSNGQEGTSGSTEDSSETSTAAEPDSPDSGSKASSAVNEHQEMLWGIVGILAIALVMRLWNLDQFEAPVFDEVYFPVFAENYLDGETFYDVHPPLGKYLIALGILIFGRNEIGYRIMPALFGAAIPVLVAGVAYRLTYWRNYALLAGAMMLTDGLFLVESRYGLMNVFLVAFGFAAQVFMLTGLVSKGLRRAILFTCSGLMLGASIAVKWNGLFFCFLFITLMIMAWTVRLIWPQHLPRLGVLAQITTVRWWHYLFCFILPAFLLYGLTWIPHLIVNPHDGIVLQLSWQGVPDFLESLIGINRSLMSGHTGSNLVVTDDTPVHPYCSTSIWPVVRDIPILRDLLPQQIWSAGAWSWPVLGRPVGYYFNSDDSIWRAVHALGNPILWWFSILTILGLSLRGLRHFRGVPAYLVLGFAANYVPWFSISRCVFIYHYMSALAFAIMAFAWVACWWLHDARRFYRGLGLTVVALVIACQIFFAPVWYGFPLQSGAFYARMWFRPNQIPIVKDLSGLNWI